MAVYPLIAGPCPYKGQLSDIMDGDICRLCHKQVHDLTDMTDDQRRAFVKACEGDACVSYRVSARTAAMLAALAAAAISGLPAAAQPPAHTDPDEDIVVVTAAGRIAGDLHEFEVAVEVFSVSEAGDRPTTPKQTPAPDKKPTKAITPKPTHD